MAFHQLNREVNSHRLHEFDLLVLQGISFNFTGIVQDVTGS